MRRVLSISMTLVFGWMLAAPLLPALLPSVFASAAEANLPACCHRGGRQHCMMGNVGGETPASGGRVGQIAAKCPYQQRSNVAAQPFASRTNAPQWLGGTALKQPGLIAQVEASYRIAASRSHQKRGPPTIL